MKSSNLTQNITNKMLCMHNTSLLNSDLLKILDITDDHFIKLIDSKVTEGIAKMVPMVIEAVKMDLNEDKEHLDNRG